MCRCAASRCHVVLDPPHCATVQEANGRHRMDLLAQTWAYIVANAPRFQQAVLVHVMLSFGALGIGMLIFIPLGVLASRGGRLTSAIVGAVTAVRVIPSLAIILLLLPVFGLGSRPAL